MSDIETPIGDCDRCGAESVALCGWCDECVAECCTLFCETDAPSDDGTRQEDWEDN